ncbi:MAG: phosphotransferase [Gammaproteobacteria bacterium]
MLIGKTELCALLPHQGAMCLLDGVLAWDTDTIVCVSHSHRDAIHPLRKHGRLAALHAFEYGAQAAAAHGVLTARAAGTVARPAYLAALRDGRLYASYLDDIAGPLEITARQQLREAASCIYEARVSAGGEPLATVKIIVIASMNRHE